MGFAYDKKLELLRAELRTNEHDIAFLRSAATAALTNRQLGLDKRRLEAVQEVWVAVLALRPAQSVLKALVPLNFKAACEISAADGRLSKILQPIVEGVDLNVPELIRVGVVQPFLPKDVWGSFEALRAICTHAVFQAKMITARLNAPEMLDDARVSRLLKLTLPHHAARIDQFGVKCFADLVEELESKLLDQLKITLMDTQSDKASLVGAGEILKISKELCSQPTSNRQ